MKALTIAWYNIVRLFRDRQGLVFVFAMPIAIIVVFGLAFGGQGERTIGVANLDEGSLSADAVALLDDPAGTVRIITFGSAESLRDAVQRNQVDMGIVIPASFDGALRSGETATIEYVVRVGEPVGAALRPLVDDVLYREAALVKAARYAMVERGITFDDALSEARDQATRVGGITVHTDTTAGSLIEPGMSGYLMGAQSQLVMFMFMISMTAAAQLIATRQLGISRRMYASPTSARTIIIGEVLGRFGVAMIQGLFIFTTTAVVFGVDWGDPVAATVILIAFAAVSSGAAMVIGSIARNPEQASSIGVGVAMLLAAFGGAMVPPEVFPDIMRTMSHVTPHAWAIDAFRDLALRNKDLTGVLPQLIVLGGFAIALISLATVRFRKSIVG